MKKNKIISALISLVVLAIFAWYFLTHMEEFRSLLSVHPAYLVFIALGHLVVLISNGLFLKVILKAFRKEMTLSQSFHASLITATGNLFLPAGGGSGVQAIFLKKTHKLSYSNFLSALSGNYVIVFLLCSLVGIIALLSINSAVSVEYVAIFLVFCVVFIVTLLLTIFGLPAWVSNYESNSNSLLRRVLRVIIQVMKGWNLIIKNKQLVIKLLVLTMINFSALLFISYFSLISVGAHISFWGLILYGVLGTMSLLVNITPGALGIKEAIYVFSSTVIGITTPQIVGAAILDRGIKYIMLILGWAWIKATGLKNNRDSREISK